MNRSLRGEVRLLETFDAGSDIGIVGAVSIISRNSTIGWVGFKGKVKGRILILNIGEEPTFPAKSNAKIR